MAWIANVVPKLPRPLPSQKSFMCVTCPVASLLLRSVYLGTNNLPRKRYPIVKCQWRQFGISSFLIRLFYYVLICDVFLTVLYHCFLLFLSLFLSLSHTHALSFSLLICTYIFASNWKAICLLEQVLLTCLTPSFIRSFKPIKIDTRLVTSTGRASSHVTLTIWPLSHVTPLTTQ